MGWHCRPGLSILQLCTGPDTVGLTKSSIHMQVTCVPSALLSGSLPGCVYPCTTPTTPVAPSADALRYRYRCVQVSEPACNARAKLAAARAPAAPGWPAPLLGKRCVAAAVRRCRHACHHLVRSRTEAVPCLSGMKSRQSNPTIHIASLP